ncbi:MAG: OmpA family protein, partial [Candidatus Kapaibacteriota bacterium]
VLVGHTDDVGTEEYNLRLGKNRVDFIIKQLVARGVSPEILEGQTAGKSQPLPRRADEDLTTYRKRLRRVEISKIY